MIPLSTMHSDAAECSVVHLHSLKQSIAYFHKKVNVLSFMQTVLPGSISGEKISSTFLGSPIAFFFVLWYNRYNCDKKQCLEDVIYLKGVSGIYGSGIPCI